MANYGTPRGTSRIGTVGQRITMSTRLTAGQHDKLARTAQALGVSISALLAELVERLEVDEHFDPGWRSRYARPDVPEQQQPLDMTA